MRIEKRKPGRPKTLAEPNWKIAFRLPESVYRQLEAMALENQRTIYQECVIAVKERLARENGS